MTKNTILNEGKVIDYFPEYVKLRNEARSLSMRTRNFHILKDYLNMGNFSWRDIAHGFGLCIGRTRQIIRTELLRFNHIVHTDNPITPKEIRKDRKYEWFDKKNHRRLLLEAYLKFRILMLEQRTKEVDKQFKKLLYVKVNTLFNKNQPIDDKNAKS